ncbi:MAG: hypothetical protein IJF39_05510 [Clostridia bacterium]|nr:hypothetical protein [Clostridia bacterium]
MNWNADNETGEESLSVVKEDYDNKQPLKSVSYKDLLIPLICGLVPILILILGAPLAKRSSGGLIWETGKPFGDSVDLYETKTRNMYNDFEWRVYGIAVIAFLVISIATICLRHKHRSGTFDFVILISSLAALATTIVFAVMFDTGTVDYVSGGGISMEQGERNTLTAWYWIILIALVVFNCCHFALLKARRNAM